MGFLYRLAHDPQVRAASFGKRGPTPWGHVWWFAQRFRRPYWCIIMWGRQRTGMVRCDVGATEAVMSIALAAPWRKQGLGVHVLRQVSGSWERTVVPPLVAYVRVDNQTSAAAFSQAGYRNVGELMLKGHRAWRLEYV